ncbi:hypothetical protein [Spirosoma fluminis]
MKYLMYVAACTLLLASDALAQDVTRKEAVKTTKIVEEKAKGMKQDARATGNKVKEEEAEQSSKAAKEAKEQAKRNAWSPPIANA